MAETFTFQAEIQQLLDILVHSLYTEREIFLRELISNASDALNRIQFEQLTNRDVLDPDAELAIEIKADEQAGTLTISDTGIGMAHDDLVNNLGVIARSGAKAFLEKLRQSSGNSAVLQDVIGQFGVGFYSVFMVADKVRVVSRSYRPGEQAYAWESTGGATYTIEPAEREVRGTDVIIYLKEDAKTFLQLWTLKDIIRRHSDYIAFPIYVGDDEQPTNKQTAIWRQDPKDITEEQYNDFYKMLTLDWEAPLHHLHVRADVPLQFYALLYIPANPERNILSPRKEPGLKLYARKVLIQEYNTDLLPEYLQFVQGVVDSEDLPLNISRESVQANRVMVNLKKTLTGRVLSDLKRMAQKNRDGYLKIYAAFSRFIKQGVVVSPVDHADIEPLLFFASTHSENPDQLFSLDEYVERLAANQDDIYYVMADDFYTASRSPHLDAFRARGIEVLYLTDPVDSIMVMGLPDYKGHKLHSVDDANIDLRDIGQARKDEAAPTRENLPDDSFKALRQRFADVLGERVRDVRQSKTLTRSPARLVSDDENAARNMFRLNRLLDREVELPVKSLELNPRHPLMYNLSAMLAASPDNPVVNLVIEQIFETALLQDGIHPDPAAMADRLTLLMQAATGTPAADLEVPPEPTAAPDVPPAPDADAVADGDADADDETP
ncbi:MAG: molecular chaperone HtpG [Chloroflexi bacterium]|nr:molecular chaperone HtpG [Chloroflexota bacterium]